MKKTLAIVLTLILAANMFTVSFAAGDAVGTAGIKWKSDDIIIYPEEPTDPTDPTGKWISGADIDFGEQIISSTEQVYNSVTQSRTEDGKYLGLSVKNATVVDAGIYAVISEFTVGTTPTMANFELELLADSAYNVLGHPDTYVSGVDVTLKADDGGVLMLNAPVGCYGGVDFEGNLTVPGDSVTALGEAQATITWFIGPAGTSAP